MTFSDLKDIQKAGTYKCDRLDGIFRNEFGYDIEPPRSQDHCLCGRSIKQQCFICPEGSTNVDDIIIVGNHCIKTYGFEVAIRGTGVVHNCEKYCEATVNKSGMKRHQQTNKCRQRREAYTSSTISTSVRSDD